MKYIILINIVSALSWKCDYTSIDGPHDTHYLYKEDNIAVVKWLEKYEYCRAKGDTNVYHDSGSEKCEYSRGLCYWDWNDNSCYETHRANDPLHECEDLLNNNELQGGLDSGRNPVSVPSPAKCVKKK